MALFKKTDQIIAVSEGVKKGLMKLGIPGHHITTIYNGTPQNKYENISEEEVRILRKKFKINTNDKVIGCISRKKKQIQILESLKYLTFKVKLIFIGIEELPEFHKIKDSFQVPHEIFFEGMVPPDKVLPHYKLFDLKVLSSTMEGLSQSLLESMAMGVPVIATAASGNLDLIQDHQNGLLFQDEDTLSLAKHISTLFDDDSLRNKLILNGKKTALEDFNIENTISNYEHFFQKLING